MRNNQPVTNVERSLKEGEFIVSKTNLKGQIKNKFKGTNYLC
jgi:hypothetical protein